MSEIQFWKTLKKYPDFDFKHLKTPKLATQYHKKYQVSRPSAKRRALPGVP